MNNYLVFIVDNEVDYEDFACPNCGAGSDFRAIDYSSYGEFTECKGCGQLLLREEYATNREVPKHWRLTLVT